MQGDQLIIRAAALQLRNGWDIAFSSMAAQRDDILLDEANIADWDQTEWEW